MTTGEALLEKFLRGASFDRHFCCDLIATGKAADTVSWGSRCLAALMLETHFLRIPARCIQEQQWLIGAAGFPDDDVSAPTLRRRLSRLNYLHRQMRGPATCPHALLDYLHVATQPCRLWFARAFFSADEITARILASVRTSRSVPDGLKDGKEWPCAAREHLAALPELVQQVATALSVNGQAYWVAEATPSEINGLVEYPLGTIALAIKPPGSDLELEIKRVGLRGPNVLSTRFGSEAKVPWAHRLQGGSAGCMIDSEARGSMRICALYRAIHGIEPPVSFVLDMQTVHALPGCNGESGLLSYFTEREEYGDDFDRMRADMAQCVEAFEEGNADLDLPGDLGLTIRFLKHLAPKQALISGTSSFRLDMLARYLSSEGPDLYFTQGLKREYTPTDARQFADDLLTEVLGSYTPPPVPYKEHAEYVRLALQVPRNRRRADSAYLSIMRQTGTFWGTLAGLGAYSLGEIFVARNAGLRSRFVQNRWQVRICFMDHDNTVAPWSDSGEFDPLIVGGMRNDARFVVDESFSMELARGEAACLRRIYQPSPDVIAAGAMALFDTARLTCQKTKDRINESQEVASLIDPIFLRTKADWDELVRSWLRDDISRDDVSAEWEASARLRLAAKGFNQAKTDSYINVLKKERRFLSGFDFLYDSGYRDFSRSNWQPGA